MKAAFILDWKVRPVRLLLGLPKNSPSDYLGIAPPTWDGDIQGISQWTIQSKFSDIHIVAKSAYSRVNEERRLRQAISPRLLDC
jgi:hypothetical protein